VFGVREPERTEVHKPTNPISRANLKRLGAAYWWLVGIGAVFTLARFSEAFLVLRAAQGGIAIACVTLHVGPGTFKPVQADRVEDHVMHEESYELPAATADLVRLTRERGGRILAVGTTAVRTLETCADPASRTVLAGSGRTRIFLYPPRSPVVCDALLTNFHLPRSTLLMLVSCFSTTERVLAAYRLAIQERFRFYSYGDCMLVLPEL
jgi:S-adenosylmethionine:tRNA ribosyltransferase-isomerase